MSSVRVYLGIGSNIHARANINKALELLEAAVGPLQHSPIYQNPAEGFEGQDFLNLVVSFDCLITLPELMKTLSEIEKNCGRQRELEQGKGSRTLDLDLLTFGDYEGVVHDIRLPRPDVFQRQFVWQPLLDLFNSKAELSDFELKLQEKIRQLDTEETAKTMVRI